MGNPIDSSRRREAVLAPGFAAQVRVGLDRSTVGTWDATLSRRTRILIPVDVQAYVVPAGGTEPTVPVTGGPGDPEPFAPGAPRPAGVHLHWAMPDALLAGRHESGRLVLPRLPDRWVVVRTLQPAGARVVGVRGWVIDAPTGSVTPLPAFTGTPAPAPAGTPVLEPLDGAAGGSLLWTASYTASAGRFGFHDPLADLTPGGTRFEGDQAAYTVAGWWSDLGHDPLAGARGPAGLDRRLAQLGWHVVHDGDDDALVVEDPRLVAQRAATGLTMPVEAAPTTVRAADGGTLAGALDGIALTAALPVAEAERVIVMPAQPTYASLVHGSVLGVPIAGALPAADDRPQGTSLGLAIGQDVDDVVSAFGAKVLGLDDAHRRSAETLVAAFTGGVIEQLGATDALEDLAEREHGDGFWSLAGRPLAASRPDRLRAEDSAPVGPLTVGRKGRGARASALPAVKLGWAERGLTLSTELGAAKGRSARTAEAATAAGRAGVTGPTGTVRAESRDVVRPAPRYFRPQPPMLALRGAHPNHRHHGDGLHDDSGKLRCRYPRECVPAIDGVVSGAAVLPSLGSGAIPDEVLTVVREAVLLNPYGYPWLAAAGAPAPAAVAAYTTRIAAEMVRLYGADGRYDGSSHLAPSAGIASANVASANVASANVASANVASAGTWSAVSSRQSSVDRDVVRELARHSLLKGTPPSPVAITAWRQPWVPLWLEWRVELDGHDSVAGWSLDGIDLERAAEPPAPEPPDDLGHPVEVSFVGRSAIGPGISTALHEGIRRWVAAELARDATGHATLPPVDRDALGGLGDLLVPLDLVSASLDGIREQLLGIPYVGVIERGPGADPQPVASGRPVPLFGGTLTVRALRLVDAFGRTLDVPADVLADMATTLDLRTPAPASMVMRPRIQHLARWLLRLVDPGQAATTAPDELREAFVDQLDPAGAVNPVAGFLLPDHIDEELEAFTVGGVAIGQLGHDAVSGAVMWETAPGRPLPPDAGPLADLDAQSRITGEIAAGLVVADAQARALAEPPPFSAMTAMLRAIDTTLWTVDTFAAVGSPTVAGLIGRPVAIVRASLRLDAPDDVDEVRVTGAGGPDERRRAFAELTEHRFVVKLGALTRTDDALLGFYVDDDYSRLHLVDRVVAAQAVESGRHRGHLGLLGAVTTPPFDPLAHPYLVPDGTILVRPGQTVRLTLLMLPVGRVHLTSGVLPRKALALADAWVTPGLRKLVPSVRVGPVLVDPAEVRMPLVNLLGDKQTFTRRTGPLTWRDDPILAATQTAYLPRLPHEAQEGWIRVTPDET